MILAYDKWIKIQDEQEEISAESENDLLETIKKVIKNDSN